MIYLTIIISILVIALILLTGRGAGLGSAWGGSGESFQTRRGVEKWIMYLTVAGVVAFLIISIINFAL